MICESSRSSTTCGVVAVLYHRVHLDRRCRSWPTSAAAAASPGRTQPTSAAVPLRGSRTRAPPEDSHVAAPAAAPPLLPNGAARRWGTLGLSREGRPAPNESPGRVHHSGRTARRCPQSVPDVCWVCAYAVHPRPVRKTRSCTRSVARRCHRRQRSDVTTAVRGHFFVWFFLCSDRGVARTRTRDLHVRVAPAPELPESSRRWGKSCERYL